MPMQNNCSRLLAFAFLITATPAVAAEAPILLSRAEWGAKPPGLKMTEQIPTAILVHHTGSAMKPKLSLAAKLQGLQRFSQSKEKLADGRMKPAWPDVPYHFYIGSDGKIAEGRAITAVGDTNTGYNPAGYIQVVVEGNFETEKVNDAQSTALKSLLKWLTEKYEIKPNLISGHNAKAQTACPGKDLEAKLPGIVAGLN
jgi:N-acetylmuramoyl-L-alanine amidase